ncbi:MAG: hypothetical protein ACT4PV_05175 [Planctomycetaceae bacterium]
MKRLLLLLPFLPLLGGCLKFESQEIEFFYDAAKDRLTLHILYQGLCHEDREAGKDAATLDKAVRDGDFCILDWPFHFQFTEVREAAANEEAPPLQREAATGLLENLSVENLGFFLDARGRLSGAQIVRLEKASKLFDLANRALTEFALPEVLGEDDAAADPESQRLLQDAAERGHRWLRFQGNSIEFAFFASDADLARMLDEALASGSDALDDFRRFLAASTFSFLREGGGVTVRVGNPTGRSRVRLLDKSDVTYAPNLVDHVRTNHGLGFDAALAPFVATEPATLPGERLRELLEALGSADAATRERAEAELATAEGNADDLRKIKACPPRILAAIEKRAERRRFFHSLPLSERVRLLLGTEGSASAKALAAERDRLPPGEIGEGPDDLFLFWRERLAREAKEAEERKIAAAEAEAPVEAVPEEGCD